MSADYQPAALAHNLSSSSNNFPLSRKIKWTINNLVHTGRRFAMEGSKKSRTTNYFLFCCIGDLYARNKHFDYMLNNGLANWVQDKSNLYHALTKHTKLIKYQELDIININLNLLSDDYQCKHIRPDLEKYCRLFLDEMDRGMFNTLSFIGPEDYRFEIRFSFREKLITWSVNYYFLSRKTHKRVSIK